MTQRIQSRRSGEIVLLGLRFTLMASAAALVGVVAHVAWKVLAA